MANPSTLEASMLILRGKRSTLDVCCCLFLRIAIGRAASRGENAQIAWTWLECISLHHYFIASLVHTPHSTLHTLRLRLYTSHCAHYTLHSTLYTLHLALYTPHSALYSLHLTLHTLHSALYTPHSTLCALHSAL